ncbi:MAG: class I SAM-dependent methyltransferase [Promethearchaeia archaeon]
MEEWLKFKGNKILQKIGFKENQTIIDFGCGSGVYALLLSKIVGNKGMIHAIDSDDNAIKKLKDIIKERNIQNINPIKTSGEMKIPLKNEIADAFLLYDVYHLLDNEQRDEILKEAQRLLKRNGFISYLATHLGNVYNVSLENVNKRMKQFFFELKEEFCEPMVHWGSIEKCNIYNYYKIK